MLEIQEDNPEHADPFVEVDQKIDKNPEHADPFLEGLQDDG